MSDKKQFTVDFLATTVAGKLKHHSLRDWFHQQGKRSAPISLANEQNELYQIKSIVKSGPNIDAPIRAVFGRCKFNETPEQGTTEDDEDSDVELKPGHGLVAKNYFIYYPRRNVLLYQRNSAGSHFSKLQRYLDVVAGASIGKVATEPIVTSDSYKRLTDGGPLRRLEISILRPAAAMTYSDATTISAIKMLQQSGGNSTKIVISSGHSKLQSLAESLKDSISALARSGHARVARATVADEGVIDLIADRLLHTILVNKQPNGRPDPGDIYAQLDNAHTDRDAELAAFFGF